MLRINLEWCHVIYSYSWLESLSLSHSLKRKSTKNRIHQLLATSNGEMQTDLANNYEDSQICLSTVRKDREGRHICLLSSTQLELFCLVSKILGIKHCLMPFYRRKFWGRRGLKTPSGPWHIIGAPTKFKTLKSDIAIHVSSFHDVRYPRHIFRSIGSGF